MNAYYAVYLYAQISGDKKLQEFSHTMLMMEIHSVKYYWHMNHDISEVDNSNNDNHYGDDDDDGNDNNNNNQIPIINSKNHIYDKLFASTRMAGNIGALDATTTTWFGVNVEYVHGINM